MSKGLMVLFLTERKYGTTTQFILSLPNKKYLHFFHKTGEVTIGKRTRNIDVLKDAWKEDDSFAGIFEYEE